MALMTRLAMLVGCSIDYRGCKPSNCSRKVKEFAAYLETPDGIHIKSVESIP